MGILPFSSRAVIEDLRSYYRRRGSQAGFALLWFVSRVMTHSFLQAIPTLLVPGGEMSRLKLMMNSALGWTKALRLELTAVVLWMYSWL